METPDDPEPVLERLEVTMAAKKKRRRYTKVERDEVLADVPTLGVMAVARKHKVPQTSVSGWLKAARSRGAAATVLSAPSPPVAQDDKRRPKAPRVAKIYTPSQKAVALEDAAKDGVTVAAKKNGMSRFSIYEWQHAVKKAAAGNGPSPTSGPAPKDIEARRDAEILDEWKQHPGLGPSQIVNQLRRRNSLRAPTLIE